MLNRSREGETSFEAIRTYYDDIDRLRPDILLVHFGVDDMYRPVYRSEFKENLIQLVRISRASFNPHIILLTSQSFADPSMMDTASIYYRAIREISIDLKCGYLPVHLWWMSHLISDRQGATMLYDEDERLPNEKGHRIIASAAIEKIRGLSKFLESIK